MVAQPAILEHLAYIRAVLDPVRDDIRELKRPLDAIERAHVRMSATLRRIDARLVRIERRLDA